MLSMKKPVRKLDLSDEKLTSKETIQKLLPYFKETLVGISDFDPIRTVGEGGFATVYKCRQLSTGETVAIKMLKPHMVSSERDVYDFLLEAQLLHKLHHKSIVKFKGICYGKLGTSKYGYESICVATEFMESGSLKDWIQAQAHRPERVVYTKRTALEWMIQVAEGLEYLHRRKFAIIHRDLKPENILLCPKPGQPNQHSAKIADFGLSVMVARKTKRARDGESVSSLDAVGSNALPELLKHGRNSVPKNAESLETALACVSKLMHHDSGKLNERGDSQYFSDPLCLTGKKGSLLYMAPEVLRSDMSNEKADVFSFATVLYEVLQGVRLAARFGDGFTISEVQKFANAVRDGYRLPIREDWPIDIKTLITQCWKDNPKERPSMRKVVVDLKAMYQAGVFADHLRTSTRTRRLFAFSFLRTRKTT